jgi:predicted dienelactone hydrolase
MTIFLFLLFSFQVIAQTFSVGQRDFTFQDLARRRRLMTYVWYPANPQAQVLPQGPGAVFLPVVAALNAPLVKSKRLFPVVLISHGSGGKAEKLFWLTQYLVQNGIIVIGVDHPGNMTGDNSADGMMRIWDRAKDLSFVLNEALKDKELGPRMDIFRVAAAGHSAGGATVLLLAGGRFSANQLGNPIPTCKGTKDPYQAKQCEDTDKINFKAYKPSVVEHGYTDPRIKAVASLDPGMARWFKRNSLKKLKADVLVFIAAKLNTPHDEIYAKEYLDLLPTGKAKIFPGTYHMSFLQPCQPNFPKDPELLELCVENENKIKIQKEVAEESLRHFQASWK